MSNAPGFESLLRPLHEAGHAQKQVYLSNLLVTFAIVRAIRIRIRPDESAPRVALLRGPGRGLL